MEAELLDRIQKLEVKQAHLEVKIELLEEQRMRQQELNAATLKLFQAFEKALKCLG